MFDYYKILDIPRHATQAQIRSAYKKLALQYHPDRNPGNSTAEEYFKVVNEAHRTLSNPDKKAIYDQKLDYEYSQYSSGTETASGSYKQQRTNSNTYNRYARRDRPQYKAAPTYKVDKTYYRAQLIAVISVILITVLVVGISQFNIYLDNKEAEAIDARNQALLDNVYALYDQGQHREAFENIQALIKQYPDYLVFQEEKENLIRNLSDRSHMAYINKDFETAMPLLELLRDYEIPMRLLTWQMLGETYLQLKNYDKAIHAYEYVLMRDQGNIELLIHMGDIYFEHVKSYEKALQYYTEGKSYFKKYQSEIYGEAFELVMPVENVSENYYDLFIKRAKANKALNHWNEAITDYNWAVYLRPSRPEGYMLRAGSYRKLKNKAKACNDWQSAKALGSDEAKVYIRSFCR